MATTSVPSCATGCACSFSRQTLHARVPGPLWISIVIMPCYVAVTLVPLTANFGTAWCSSPREIILCQAGICHVVDILLYSSHGKSHYCMDLVGVSHACDGSRDAACALPTIEHAIEPLGPRLRSSSLAYARATVLTFGCPLGRHILEFPLGLRGVITP